MTLPHRRAETCAVCRPLVDELRSDGWFLPNGVPDLGYCFTRLPVIAQFGTCRLCSVSSAHLIVLSVWQAGLSNRRLAECLEVCSAHEIPSLWRPVDWQWLLIDG